MAVTNNENVTQPASTEAREEASSQSVPAYLRANIGRILIFALGDLLVFLIFAMIGRRSHGEVSGLAALPQVALTAAPFAAAWFIVSPFVGAYKRSISDKPRAMALRTLISWLVTWPVAMTFRGIFVDHAVPPLTFGLITLGFNTLMLVLWRTIASLIFARAKR